MTDPLIHMWEDRDWTAGALCAQVDPELFFPETGGNALKQIREAKRICSLCSVTVPCLAEALTRDMSGIWAGTTDQDRLRMRQERIAS